MENYIENKKEKTAQRKFGDKTNIPNREKNI